MNNERELREHLSTLRNEGAGIAELRATVDTLNDKVAKLRRESEDLRAKLGALEKQEPVARILPGNLQRNQYDKDPAHWCHDVLLYSPNNPGDSPEKRVPLYLSAGAKPVTHFTAGHCAENKKPGGCQLHNLQCGYPSCDRRPAKGAKP